VALQQSVVNGDAAMQAAVARSSSGVARSLTTHHFSAASSDSCYSHGWRSNCQEQQSSISDSGHGKQPWQEAAVEWHDP